MTDPAAVPILVVNGKPYWTLDEIRADLDKIECLREQVARYPETARKLGWLDPAQALELRDELETNDRDYAALNEDNIRLRKALNKIAETYSTSGGIARDALRAEESR